MIFLTWILTPFGRIITGISIVILLCTGAYLKGRHDRGIADKVAIERDINEAVRTGQKARADALRKFDAGRLRDKLWFID